MAKLDFVTLNIPNLIKLVDLLLILKVIQNYIFSLNLVNVLQFHLSNKVIIIIENFI